MKYILHVCMPAWLAAIIDHCYLQLEKIAGEGEAGVSGEELVCYEGSRREAFNTVDRKLMPV